MTGHQSDSNGAERRSKARTPRLDTDTVRTDDGSSDAAQPAQSVASSVDSYPAGEAHQPLGSDDFTLGAGAIFQSPIRSQIPPHTFGTADESDPDGDSDNMTSESKGVSTTSGRKAKRRASTMTGNRSPPPRPSSLAGEEDRQTSSLPVAASETGSPSSIGESETKREAPVSPSESPELALTPRAGEHDNTEYEEEEEEEEGEDEDEEDSGSDTDREN